MAPKQLLIVFPGALLIFASGYWLGGKSSGQTKETAGPRIAAAPKSAGPIAPAAAGNSAAEKAGDAANTGGKTAAAMAILRKKDRLQRMAEWLPLLASASPEELKSIGEAMVSWYSSGGVVGNDELDFLQFREGQVFGQQTIEDMFPKEPNGKININHHRKMKGWASADPAAAKAWLDALEDGSVKRSLVASWFEGTVMADPAGLETRYASLSSADKSGALGSMVDALHRRDGMEGLTRWFEQQSASGADWPRQEAFEKLMWRAGQTIASARADDKRRIPPQAS